jgi:hypothetical protein
MQENEKTITGTVEAINVLLRAFDRQAVVGKTKIWS